MPVASVKAVGTPVFGTGSSISPSVPSHSSGDLLILFVGSSANASVTPTHATPAGWTPISDAKNNAGTVRAKVSAFYKVTLGSEAAPSVTVTPTGDAACHHSAVIFSVENQDPEGDPFLEGGSSNQATGASSLDLTLDVGAQLVFMAVHHADDVATGVTESNGLYGAADVATDDATGIDGFLAVFSGLAPGDDPVASTVTFTDGGTGVGIAGVGFSVIGDTVVRAEIASTVAGPTSAMEAATGPSGTLASTLEGATSSMSAAVGAAADLTSSLEGPSSSVAGAVGVAAAVDSTIAGPTAAMAGDVGAAAELESTVEGPSSSIGGEVGAAADFESTVEGPASSISAASGPEAALSSALEGPSSSMTVGYGPGAALVSTVAGPTSAIAGEVGARAALSSTVGGPVSSMQVNYRGLATAAMAVIAGRAATMEVA